jgi:hypothetical protein
VSLRRHPGAFVPIAECLGRRRLAPFAWASRLFAIRLRAYRKFADYGGEVRDVTTHRELTAEGNPRAEKPAIGTKAELPTR